MITKKVYTIILYVLMTLVCSTAFAMEVAITVDDLPQHGNLPPHVTRLEIAEDMLRVFKKHNIQGIYGFINGKNINDESMSTLQAWIKHGQLLGNHTFSHLDIVTVDSYSFIADIDKNDPILAKYMGNKNYKYFRYPYLAEGNTQEKRDKIRQYLVKQAYQIAPVTMDFFDYEWNAPYARCVKNHDQNAIQWLRKTYIEQSLNAITIAHELSMMLFDRDIKYILLIHIGAFDALMLDEMLTTYEKQGVEFITLADALSDDAYKINSNLITDRPYTFLNQIRISKGLKNPEIVKQLYASLPEMQLSEICAENR